MVKGINLSSKIIGLVFVILSVLSVSLSYVSFKNYSSDLIHVFTEKGIATVYSLEANIGNKEDLSEEKLFASIQKHIWLDPDITDIDFNLLRANDLITFVSNNHSYINNPASNDSLQSFNDGALITRITNINGRRSLKVVSPISISGQKVGTIEIAFTLESIDRKIRAIAESLILDYTAITLTFILIFYLFLNGIIIEPILKINKALKALSKGDLNQKVALSSNDEIGNLAIEFNGMAARLKESYERLKKEEARLLSSIESLSMGFLITNNKGDIVLFNQAAQSMFDLKAEDMTLNNISKKLVSGLDLMKEYRLLATKKASKNFPGVGLGEKYLKVFIAPIKSTNRQNRGTIGSIILFEDITEQRILDQSKSNFIAITTHEMRTPLAIIRGNSELLLESSGFKKAADKKMIESIQGNSVRLLDILHDFMDVAVLEGKLVDFKKEELNIATIVEDIVNDLKGPAIEKKLFLQFDYHEVNPLIVTTNKEKSRQVISNLIANAIHYTEKGGITVSIKKSGNFARILISDTGIGISQENQTYLFKKFSTVNENFITSKEYGSGLGLYITKLLMESIGGDVRLEKSDIGIGSTFSASFPLANL